jgi:amino acid transporter/nucleotide-binding universal stress UspA family protein
MAPGIVPSMLVTQKRPRDLHWYHAGPLLFGDWGTSRLYVLGLAFAFTGNASPIYLVGLSVLMIGVAWAYAIICSKFHDGGGVYTAARQINPLLSVIGATLLMADYIVTAAMSITDAFHYLGVEGRWPIFACCAGTLGLIALVNWFGAKNAGRFALWIAVAAIGSSAVIAVMVLPFVPRGLNEIDWGPPASLLTRWEHFTSVILALSGVEAVANMTGIMKEPVDSTSKKTIWPVLAEVVSLNLVFSIALLGIIEAAKRGAIPLEFNPETQEQVKNSAMRVMAVQGASHWFGPAAGLAFGRVAAIIFALLLISAGNTVVVDMIAIIYSLGRDGEVPRKATELNYSGVPKWPLFIACGVPTVLLLVVHDLEALADLYAIGVCGAIAMNMLCCAYNPRLQLSRGKRTGMWIVGGIVFAVWLTIALTKHHATIFAGGLVAVTLLFRWAAARFRAREEPFPEPELGWLSELRREPLPFDPSRPRIMLAARGRGQAEFAVDLARKRGATLFVIYVRTLRVLEVGTHAAPRVEDDREAQESLGSVVMLAGRYRVPVQPIYVQSTEISHEILDYTVTFGCDTLIMGKSRRRAFARALEGDVIAQIAKDLPSEVALVTRDSSPHDMGPEPGPEVVKPAGDEGIRPRI